MSATIYFFPHQSEPEPDVYDMGLVIAGIAEGRYHAEPIPEDRKKPEQTLTEKVFKKLREWI